MNGIINCSPHSEVKVISVIIPFYNEQENLPILHGELCAALSGMEGFGIELLYVNDGSNDGSETALLGAVKKNNDLDCRLINLSQNHGLSTALWAGIQHSRGDIVVTIDSDLQNDPADIPDMVRLLENAGVEAVIGIRARRKDTVVKKLTSRCANAIRNYLIEDGVRDTGCTLKVFSGKAVRDLPFFKGMHRFLPFLLKLRGYRFLVKDVNHRERKYGEPKYYLLNRLIGPFCDLLAAMWMKNRNIVYQVKDDRMI